MGTQEFGEYLRQRREEQGLTIADVSDRTKIHMRHIRAIEEGRLEALPGIVYAKAFVRHYARAVGEDPDAMAAQFHQVIQLQGESAGLTGYRRRSRRRARRGSRIPWPWVVVIAALAGLGLLIAKTVDFGGEVAVPPQGTPGGLSSEPALEAPTPESPFGLEPEAVPGLLPEPAPEAGPEIDRSPPQGAAPAEGPALNLEEGAGEPGLSPDNPGRVNVGAGEPPLTSGSGPVGSEEPGGAQGAATAQENEAALAASSPGVVLEVAVERASWFNVEADGRVIFTGVLDDGESRVWVASEELKVRYGRPEGVFITLNGEFLGRAGTGVITRVYSREGVAGI